MNINGSKVYALNNDTGEWFELGEVVFDLTHPISNDESHIYKDENLEFECSFRIQLKDMLKIWGLTNNSIRLHGGKAIRTVPKRFWR